MKVLLIHPDDVPDKGPWIDVRWDRIADIGMGGANTYERWSREFECPAATLKPSQLSFKVSAQTRDLLGLGCGRVIDEHGLDWWEIMSILLVEEVDALILLQKFVTTLASGDEVHVSRPGMHADLLNGLLPGRVKAFPLRREARKRGLRHVFRVLNKLSASQIADVLGDKYDSGYQFRGRLARKRPPSTRPVVLLPTAYVNVSRTGVAYANTFPEEDFLLVATRRSGWLKNPPPNVATAWLSSYVDAPRRNHEYEDLERRWRNLLEDLAGATEFGILQRLGYLDNFPQRFRHALAVRDAWRNVLDREPVQAVICADDSNPYTRIPLLLAQERGLASIACHHGALDGRYVFKRSYGDVIWVKGKMEEDYLARKCGVPRGRIEIGAPALPADWNSGEWSSDANFRPHILFISEAYEVGGGRAREFYRDMLPGLADLALAEGRELVVKLHPAESERERGALLAKVLSPEQKKVTRVVAGPLTGELLSRAWFAVTILSTVATECAVRGIPCFLCKWLESWPYGYVEQFERFGVGIGLNNPGEFERIPEYLRQYSRSAEVAENCWQPVAPGRLRELMASSQKPCTAAAS